MIHFHRWDDWIDMESSWLQIRWCRDCNKRQRRLIKLVVNTVITNEPSVFEEADR